MLRLLGVLLLVGGLVSLVQGRITVPGRDTIVDDIQIPPVVGGIGMAAGVMLLMSPRRRRGAF
jgi:hypothetical protein